MAPKSSVKMTVLRKGAEQTITLTLAEMPNSKEARANAGETENDADLGKLGLSLAPAANVAGSGAEGVVVTSVDSNGIAADQGFSTGDVILEIGGKSVSTPSDVRDVVKNARTEGKRSVLFIHDAVATLRFMCQWLAVCSSWEGILELAEAL